MNAVLDTTTYDRGIKITDRQITAFEATQLRRHEFHGDWNYTLTADHTPDAPDGTYLIYCALPKRAGTGVGVRRAV